MFRRLFGIVDKMVKIEFTYSDGREEVLYMTDHEASEELQKFLSRYPEAGKKHGWPR